MTNEASGPRGIMLTIDHRGGINLQILGQVNEAELLGLGAYISSLLPAANMEKLRIAQLQVVNTVNTIEQALNEFLKGEPIKFERGQNLSLSERTEGPLCMKDSSLASSPSLDSGSSSETSL